MSNNDLCFLSAIDLAARIRNRQVSAVEVVESFLSRISRINPKINAYITVCREEAIAAARQADEMIASGKQPGPLQGVPFSVKDLVFTAGVRTTGGSRIYENFIPGIDSICVARLKRAGAILLGKTNTPEFGYKATTENLIFGATRNPWNTELTAGGSSGGAAAATASGLSPLSVASDGGGSIRIPASFCGVFGIKPSYGKVPAMPGFGGWRTLSHIGPITRAVRDAALMLDVMAGPDEMDRTSIPSPALSCLEEMNEPIKGLRIGFSPDLGYATVASEVATVVEQSLPAFEELGHSVKRTGLNLSTAKQVFEIIVNSENTASHLERVKEHRDIMDQGLVKFIELGYSISAIDYIKATKERDNLASLLADFFREFDLLVTPTMAVAPFVIGDFPREIEGVEIDKLGWLPFTYPFNLTGNPAASAPCGRTSDGLPVGLQIVGPRYRDGLVLNLAAQFEEARPWNNSMPEL